MSTDKHMLSMPLDQVLLCLCCERVLLVAMPMAVCSAAAAEALQVCSSMLRLITIIAQTSTKGL